MISEKKLIIAVTGASGACYAAGMIRFLAERGYEIKIIFSEPGKIVWREELDIDLMRKSGRTLLGAIEEGLGICDECLTVCENTDLTASISSGSSSPSAMIVIPCSMGTLARIASGISENLIERSADVILKEGKKLILVPRETPLNRIHLKNMLHIQEAGGVILPAMPGFYNNPQSLNDIVDFVVGKVLDRLGIEHSLYRKWEGIRK